MEANDVDPVRGVAGAVVPPSPFRALAGMADCLAGHEAARWLIRAARGAMGGGVIPHARWRWRGMLAPPILSPPGAAGLRSAPPLSPMSGLIAALRT
jgi:hypothetical protein